LTFTTSGPPRPACYDADVDEMRAMGLAVLGQARDRLTGRIPADPTLVAVLRELDTYAAELAAGQEDAEGCPEDDDETPGPGTATLTVYGARAGEPEVMLRREQATLAADTDEEAQRLADEIATGEPVVWRCGCWSAGTASRTRTAPPTGPR